MDDDKMQLIAVIAGAVIALILLGIAVGVFVHWLIP